MNETRVILVTAIVFVLIGTLTSCTDFIDPSAANSFAAIIAVIGEYLYAIIALVMVVLLWILRPAGVALALLGVLGLCDFVDLTVNASLLIFAGVIMFIASFAPIKPYEPLVIISKNFKIPKAEKDKDKHNSYQGFFMQLIVGFITLIIEYSIFVR